MEQLLKEAEQKSEAIEKLNERFSQLELTKQIEREELEQQQKSESEALEKTIKAAKDQLESLTKSLDAAKVKHEEEVRRRS